MISRRGLCTFELGPYSTSSFLLRTLKISWKQLNSGFCFPDWREGVRALLSGVGRLKRYVTFESMFHWNAQASALPRPEIE